MAHTKQKNLAQAETWILPMNHRARDFEATISILKESMDTATIAVQATLTPLDKIAADGTGADWFDFVPADDLTAFSTSFIGTVLVANISKPVVALKFGAGGGFTGQFKVSVLQAGT